jgi:diguanylate cyclase (GGDEF)-like protein
MVHSGTAGTDPGPDPVADLARTWLRGITAVAFVPGTRAQARHRLEGLLRQMIAALAADSFAPAVGGSFGAQLVQWRMMTPEVLGTTLNLLGEHLPGLAREHAPDTSLRVRQLLAAVATGFATAQHHAAAAAGEQINAAYRAHWHSDLIALQDKLRYSLLHDLRTGLHNRGGLRETLTAAIDRPYVGRVGVCLLGIERFAQINDALGHDHGDRLLQAVAASLRALAAENGWELAQPAEDQFVLLLIGTAGLEEVVKAADRAGRLLRAPIVIDGHDLRLGITAGVVEGPTGQTQPDGWLRKAHFALDDARQDGREFAVFDPGRAAEEIARHRLAAAMPHALERGEFVPYFQPLYNLGDRRIIGLEALARWERPGSEVLGPQQFIGLAEKTGLIHALGRSLLAQACAQGAAWQPIHPGLLISVNLSPLQLSDPGLVADVDMVLRSSGLPAGSLQLEITESAAVDDPHHTLDGLAELGVRLAIDDFGTGYSTFAALPTLPVTAVKLAAELLPRRPEDTARRTVLGALIRLCHDLSISVTGEGIETPGQERLLYELGCDHGQGYLFARPAAGQAIRSSLG